MRVYHKRNLEHYLKDMLAMYNIVAITGARQTGKSTFIKNFIDDSWQYYSFDDRELLQRVKNDPELFVQGIDHNLVIDEAQKCPVIFHSLKKYLDHKPKYKIILSGSANFLLMKSITESLAGRIGLLEMANYSVAEALNIAPKKLLEILSSAATIEEAYAKIRPIKPISDKTMQKLILLGGYPQIHNLTKAEQQWQWFKDYIATYIERDLRDLTQVADIDTFQKVYKIFAFQTGQLLNFTNIARDLGLSPNTVKKYFSILRTSYQCQILQPYGYSAKKQLIKSPKLFYRDTGLINFFMNNDSINRMHNCGIWGSILETHVFHQIYSTIKDWPNACELSYWRTNNGAEIDFIIKKGRKILPIEVKSAIAIPAKDMQSMTNFIEDQKEKIPFGIVIYRGESAVYLKKNILAIPLGLLN